MHDRSGSHRPPELDQALALIDLYSRRQRQGRGADVYVYETFPEKLRVQLIHIWSETIGVARADKRAQLFHSIVKLLRKERGQFTLVRNHDADNMRRSEEELRAYFMAVSETEHALDVAEITLRAITNVTGGWDYANRQDGKAKAEAAVAEFNERAKEIGFGFQFVEGDIIRIDSEYMHSEAVMPALGLLRDVRFTSAQAEFMSAHEHYRHGRSTEVLVDCLKAFESTMKVICDERGWAYDKAKGASELVRACLDAGLIPSYWQTHFAGLRSVLTSGIPTPRNREGGHGAGSQPLQDPPPELLSYVLHMTAATILFLVDAASAKA